MNELKAPDADPFVILVAKFSDRPMDRYRESVVLSIQSSDEEADRVFVY